VAFLAAARRSPPSRFKLPAYLRDPWEYDFDRLGSRESKHGGREMGRTKPKVSGEHEHRAR